MTPLESSSLQVGDRIYWDHADDRGIVTEINTTSGNVTIRFDDGTFVTLDPEGCSIVERLEDAA